MLLQQRLRTNMDTNPMQNQGGMMPNTSPIMPHDTKKSDIGSIIATVIIIAIIILGGLYFWGKRIETQRQQQALMQNAGTTTDETAAATEATKIETVSQDDSLNAIDSETKTTNTTNLSSELQ